MILRDMTEEDLDVLFDIQDDEVAHHQAAFTTPDGGARDAYLEKWRKILADDEITKKVVLLEGEVVGSVGAYALDEDTEVTYWIRRDLWGRGLATAALAELLSVVPVRPLWARAAADNIGSAQVLLRNGFKQVGEETAFAEARGTEITELVFRLDAGTPAEIGLARWHELVASRDPARLPELIAENAVFRSPAVHTPQEGRELVTMYLAGAIQVLGPTLTYHDEWVRERDAVLRFTSEVDGLQVEGVDMITWDDEGQIVGFTVMIRPFKALQAVIARMLEQLTGAGKA